MITNNLKWVLLIGSMAAVVFGVLRLIQDGVGGETVAAITFNTACLLFTGAAIIQAIEQRNNRPPPRDG